MARTVNYKDVLSKIVLIWVVCYGSLTLQVVAGYFMSHVLLPYVGFLLIFGIIALGNYNLRNSSINCSLMTHYTVYSLAVSGVVMLVMNLMNTHFITNRFSEFALNNYPFHASFVVYPIATMMFGIAMLRRGNPQYCIACRTTSEFSVSEALRRNVLHHESKVQIRLAFAMSLLISVVTYLYYFYFYRNGQSALRNSPDVFFLYILPAVAFIMSAGYILSRYFSVEFEISLKMSQDDHSRKSHIRYMVVWRDQMLLKDIVGGGLAGMWDTPADITVPPTDDISMFEAEKAFRRLYGSERFTLKRLFASSNRHHNDLHCAAFLDDEDDPNDMGGEWFSLRDVDLMLKTGVIARPFAVEMHRIFTITMAWKTYDREGRRLYPIKHYRPTFRLRDFKDWDVDYEDVHWISVSQNNQDRPFYNLRRFWRKFTGVEKRWQRKDS